MGFPGWHLECSAMSMKYLGESFDIHGGGIENQFPHHDDEIAQAEAATGKPFVKYWLHNNMVTVGGQKMGKSLGNFITLKDAFAKWDPMVLRLFILQSHYRSPLDFSDEALGAAAEGYKRVETSVRALRGALAHVGVGDADPKATKLAADVRCRFAEAMDDDFNTAGGLAVLFDFVREGNRLVAAGNLTRGTVKILVDVLTEMGTDVLGLTFMQATGIKFLSAKPQYALFAGEDFTPSLVQMLIDLRNDARAAKNFAQADAIRKRLDEIGIILEDAADGTKWRFK
jgi:cysteinyl-tRNA synthetase